MQTESNSPFNFEKCQKCSICVSVCPMKEANPLYPGPKQAGPDGERYRLKSPEYFDAALKFCLGCKRCEAACPSGVKVADLISRARAEYGRHARPLRDFALSNTDLVGSVAVPFAPIVNAALSLKPAGVAMSLLGIDRRRRFPSYSKERFEDWLRDQDQSGYSRFVSYFHGCYVGYNHPLLGQDFVRVMNACGYGVRALEKEKCCGVALIANGFHKQAREQAGVNVASFGKALDSSSEAVLVTSSSCANTILNEYPHLLGLETPSGVDFAAKFIVEKVQAGEIRLVFKQGLRASYVYHTACHMQALGYEAYSIALLRMIPGLEVKVLPQECCGIAGTFGFKKENYDLSQKIGSKLFALIDRPVACDCETCKWQIEMSTGHSVHNPIEILHAALDLEATAAANALP